MTFYISIKKIIQCFSASILIGITACNVQTGKNNYILAERLFNDQKYGAAVQEFQKIVDRDPKSPLSIEAMFRIGTIEYLYLANYSEAVKNFKQFSLLSKNKELIYKADKDIGEILFSKQEDYRVALEHYQKLLEKYPDTLEKDFFMLRIAKSYYGLMDFKNALQAYRDLLEKNPNTKLKAESKYQIGNIYFTKGECDEAIKIFKEVIAENPESDQEEFSRFNIASCLEELEKPTDALDAYQQIKRKNLPKNLLDSKIKRLNDRVLKKNR